VSDRILESADWAHSPNETGRPEPLEDHLRCVAELCEQFASRFNAGSWGRVAGYWHDLGKYSREFQARVRGTNLQKVDHSTAGAKFAHEVAGDAGKLLRYCIAGHHGGLPDYHDALDGRLTKAIPEWRSFAPVALLAMRPDKAAPVKVDPEDVLFQVSFLTRMLFSALVDADFLATEEFLDKKRSRVRKAGPSLSGLLPVLESHLARLSNDNSEVNRRRRDILAHCVDASASEPGLFSLTVPTGGGKTLASLMFAIKHALKYGMERVIVVVPYCSIIEQTAQIYRDIFAPLNGATVIEHHSAFDVDNTSIAVRLATENWDGSIIVTTAVQFFDSLFSNKPGRCRKLHRIARSVVILDEAQILPTTLLAPCMSALRALRHYGTSIVLCTATQPALGYREDFQCGLKDVREIVPDPIALYQSMRRVRSEIIGPGVTSNDELVERLVLHQQALCIVNTTRHAALLASAVEGGYHLSARMCPAHRLAVLAQIKGRLKAGLDCRVISTQVVECGVDIDFPIAYRAMAGIDQIAQAAGRCNREGLAEFGRLFIFEPESNQPPAQLRQSADVARQVLPDHLDDPLNLAAVDRYFHLHYWTRGNHDAKGVLPELTERGIAQIQFKSAADKFALIDSPTTPVIIPWGAEGAELCDQLHAAQVPWQIRALVRKLQRYTVNVWPEQYQSLISAGRLEGVHDQYRVLADMRLYSEATGLAHASDDGMQEVG
jgi:CRISPR-associated endonuclease/helicase Cas3